MREYRLTEKEATMAFRQVASHCAALKNWIVTAIEMLDYDKAQSLVAELREYQALYGKLNVEAHKFIDAAKED